MLGFLRDLFVHPGSSVIRDAVKKGAFLVDVRTPAEFSAGSITGAVNIPLDKLPGQLAKLNNKKSIVVFCRSGNRSYQAKRVLEQQGFRNVINGGSMQQLRSLVQS